MKTILGELFAERKIHNFPAGKLLISEGDEAQKIYYIASGYVKVYTVISSERQRTVFLYRPGDVFPLTTYLSGSSVARFFYECLTPVQVYSLTSKQFAKKMNGNLKVGEALISYTTKIDAQFYKRVKDMVADSDALTRLIKVLYFLIDKAGKGKKDQIHIDVPVSTMEIANLCGLSREETSNILNYLRKKEIVVGSNSLIVDKTKLLALKKS